MIPTYLPWVVYDIPEAANPATGLDMLLLPAASKGDRIAQRLGLECLKGTVENTVSTDQLERERSSDKIVTFIVLE